MKKTLATELHESDLSVAYAVRIPTAIIIDHQLNNTFLIDEDNNQSRINAILEDIKLLKSIPNNDIEGKLSEEKSRQVY